MLGSDLGVIVEDCGVKESLDIVAANCITGISRDLPQQSIAAVLGSLESNEDG